MQDDPICKQDGHTGYTLEDDALLPDASTFDPEATLPTGMVDEGKFGTNFNCTTPIPETCHYVYVPATENEEAKWVECKGRILRN
ncbi:hypothetical protein JKG61_16600 [Sphingobacterium sp. C459-1T]|uniref:Uncharacterized protein n=2 Tax=Sphingobacterium faecale TaxID=2803775 RepID=A0ABS1R6Q9_9SPHI|nr:hypothetical protein [Sphingobacterium faecale]